MKYTLKKNIIISRTDSIGDVILTLPVARVLKCKYPQLIIAFLGKRYTKPVIEACNYVDQFIDVDDFLNKEILVCNEKPEAILHVFPVKTVAKRAYQLGIPFRIGTTNRIYHWHTCNQLVKLSRKKSDLHEAQLNLQLLRAFGIDKTFSLTDIADSFGLKKLEPLKSSFSKLLAPGKFNLILHPKSQGSAREWGLDNFISLIKSLDKDKYQLFVSGTQKEHTLLQPLLDAAADSVTDISGKMDLGQFISFINHCDGLVANSTGPLHIAAALGKYTFGIYAPIHPVHPGRWSPLGKNAQFFVVNRKCNDCKSNKNTCHCIKEIPPVSIKNALNKINLF